MLLHNPPFANFFLLKSGKISGFQVKKKVIPSLYRLVMILPSVSLCIPAHTRTEKTLIPARSPVTARAIPMTRVTMLGRFSRTAFEAGS